MNLGTNTRLQFRLNSLFMFCMLIGVAIVLAWFSTRYDRQFDWTSSGRHTLSDASREVLSRLEGPLQITAYASDNQELRGIIRKIISRYQGYKPDISLSFSNPLAVPDEVRNLGITVDGELLVRYQDRVEHIKSDSEEEIANALQRLARGGERWLAFIEGHGERNALGQANHDLGSWVSSLTSRGYQAQPINLAHTDTIPDNTSVLIIAGPQVDYLPGEVEKILNYINDGGNLLWLLDPGKLYGLNALAEALFIEVHPGTVIDFVGQLLGVNDPTIAIATGPTYQAHPALDGFNITTLFPAASPIEAIDNQTWHMEPVIVSGDHTWAENGTLQGEVAFDQDIDDAGPLNLVISLTRSLEVPDDSDEPVTRKQRIIISGDGDFLANTYVGNSGNLDLGVRLVNWLSNDDELIAIPPRIATDLTLELSNSMKIAIIAGFLIVLPLGLLASGVIIWWRRRKL
ncbi:MAG: GldG family protein [Thiotrichales bacterium]|nr:GldG family protein [Thiotrichales bacterium]